MKSDLTQIAAVGMVCFSLTGCFLGGGGGSCLAYNGTLAATAPITAEGIALRHKFQSGQPIVLAIMGDSTTLGSDTKGLEKFLQSKNAQSQVHNFGYGGWKFETHLQNQTAAKIGALFPRPDATFIALGINNVQYTTSITGVLALLAQQVRDNGMLPVYVKENNIACPGGSWVPQPMWKFFRAQVDFEAAQQNVEVLDLGSADGAVDPLI